MQNATRKNNLKWLNRLAERGWVLFSREDGEFTQLKIREIGKALGVPCAEAKHLVPKTHEDSRPNTLSSVFGLNPFPIHTDFATKAKPARYLILSAPRPREARTHLYDGNNLFIKFSKSIRESIFLVHADKNPFAARFVDNVNGESIIRYNPSTMSPLNSMANIVDRYIKEEWIFDEEINWNDYRCAVIDNWRCLHSRGEVKETHNGCGLWRFAMGGMK